TALRLSSGTALRLGSGTALRLGSGTTLRLGSTTLTNHGSTCSPTDAQKSTHGNRKVCKKADRIFYSQPFLGV
ncbi:MAG: hypothetical protein II030_02785, partial [Treponema sp.]|nr:hypothetical protein [Treponema sp.]